MPESLAPANGSAERRPAEALCIGFMLLAYGELELMVGECLSHALGSSDTALRTMFRIMGETSRVDAADALMRDSYIRDDLRSEYAEAMGAVRHCIRLRNQYAHCHWADHWNQEGLWFTELTGPAKASEKFDFFFRHVDLGLLQKQKEYFDYAAAYLRFLRYKKEVRAGMTPDGIVQAPTKRAQPNLHNPPEVYIPPWLSEDKRRRHIEHFRKRAGSDRSRPAAKQVRARKPSARQAREKKMRAALSSRRLP